MLLQKHLPLLSTQPPNLVHLDDGLLGPAVIIIDNIASLTLETLTGKIVNEFFRDLKRIQRGTENAITFIIADHIGKTPVGQPLDDSNIAGSANVARFAHTIVFVDFSARGSDYRFIKFSKLRKGALPDEVLEVHISEEEYVHFEVIGHASEAEVIRTKSNLKRFGQEIKDVVDEEEDTPEEDPKIAERSGRLEHNVESRRPANPDRVLQQKHILERMRHVPQMYNIFRIFAQKQVCMIDNQLLNELKGRELVLFVADKDEISQADVPFPVVYTGMGKMRMFSGLLKWYESGERSGNPTVLNIGSAGSARFPIGEILNCTCFVNGGSELIYDKIELPGNGCSVFSGDYFMSTQTFSPEQVKALSQQYDLFDMEAYAVAHFCQMHNIPFYCLKAVSDNLDGSLKDWRGILSDIRVKFTSLLKDLG